MSITTATCSQCKGAARGCLRCFGRGSYQVCSACKQRVVGGACRCPS